MSINDKSYYNMVFSVLPCLSNWLWSNVCNMYVTESSFRKNDYNNAVNVYTTISNIIIHAWWFSLPYYIFLLHATVHTSLYHSIHLSYLFGL